MPLSSVILVRVLGNTKGLSRALDRAYTSLGGLERIGGSITGGMKIAAVAVAALGAAAVGAGAIGAGALAAIPAVLLGIGIAAAAQSKRVKSAFSGLKDHVVSTMREISAPLIEPLVRAAGRLRAAFDTIAPSLERIYKAAAPLIDQMTAQLLPIAEKLGPMLEEAFAAGAPVLLAFVKGLTPLTEGMAGFFRELAGGSGQFATFVTALMTGLGALLPAFGRLLVALAPIGTAIVQTLIPALVSLLDWISARVGPAFQAVTGFFREHATVAKAVGLALIGLVVTIKAIQVAMALASAATLAFTVVAKIVRAAIIVWKNAQLALNLAMMLNPIGLVIAAIVALVAIFVIAWKKSETFRSIVIGAWNAIKSASSAVWGFIKDLIGRVWDAIKSGITTAVNAVKSVVTSVWNAIKGATSAVWNGIKSVIGAVAGFISGVVRTNINLVRSVISGVWEFVTSATTRTWNALKGIVSRAVDAVLGVVRGIKDKILGALSGAASWLVDVGRNILQGMIDGITGAVGRAVQAVKDAVGSVIDGAKNLLGISSPSRVFRDIGQNTTAGFVEGLKRSLPDVRRTLDGLNAEVQRFAGNNPLLGEDIKPPKPDSTAAEMVALLAALLKAIDRLPAKYRMNEQAAMS